MHILKRKNTYYYKLKIPVDLRGLIPLDEVRFSLRTVKKRDALYLASNLTSKYYTLFLQIRSGIYTEEQVVTLINQRLYLNLSQLNLNKVNKSLPKVYTLVELSQMYTKDKVLTNTWTDKTLKAYESVFNVFSKVVNIKKDVKSISRKELQDFKYTLSLIPPMKPKYINYSIEELQRLNLKPLATSTAQKYLSFIVSLFKWCEEEGYVPKSVATNLSIKNEKLKEATRVPYSLSDLKRLFYETSIYTKGFKDSLLKHPERVYIPLISMYQGMRLNEIAQLYTEDILKIDGVYCIDINKKTSDKRLKNESSRRIIPIHKELIELGFLDYVKKKRDKGSLRLWSNLSLGSEGYGTNFRKWYGVFNRKFVTKDNTKTFHSFRHLFTNTLKQISLKENIDHHAVKYLLGHSMKGDVTIEVYTHGYKMSDLSDILNKLYYEDLDLTVLKESPVAYLRSYRD